MATKKKAPTRARPARSIRNDRAARDAEAKPDRILARVNVWGIKFRLVEHHGVILANGQTATSRFDAESRNLIISSAVPRRKRDGVVMSLVMQAAEHEGGRRLIF